MVLEAIDKNTYIHRPNFEGKARSKLELSPVKVLSNDSSTLAPSLKTFAMDYQPNDYMRLGDYVKETPELLSIIKALVTDIVSDGYAFESLTNSNASEKKATEFCESNLFSNLLEKWLMDTFTYGNGFMVINKVTEEEIKSVLNAHYEMKDYSFKEFSNFVDELSYKNVNLQIVPAQTMSIKAEDIYGEDITYKQNVNGNSVIFKPSQIIHLKDIELDGKNFGYSRIYAIKSELQTLFNAKNYLGRFFDNNGTPNILFIAPKMSPGSKEYNDFVLQLNELKKSANKQRNLLATSEIETQKLNDVTDKMQFNDLMKYVTALLAMTYQMPATRYGMSSGGNAEEATLTTQGYSRNISAYQDKIEKLLNSQLFIPLFNVRFKFHRSYKEDELREAQILKTKLDAIEQLLRTNLITKEGAAIMASKAANFDEKYANKEEDPEPEELNVQYMQGQKTDKDLSDESVQNKKKLRTPKKYKE